MADPREATVDNPAGHRTGHRAVLVPTFLFVLTAVVVSDGLVVYTAWHQDLKDGLFALAFAVLSARAVLSWCLWRHSYQLSAVSRQQDRGGQKPAEATMQ